MIYDYERRTYLRDNESTRMLIEYKKPIKKVKIYCQNMVNPVFNVATAGQVFHAFVLFETAHWYWSVEKNSKGLVLQRSRNWRDVANKLEGKTRTGKGEVWHWRPFSSHVKNCSLKDGVCDVPQLILAYQEKYPWGSQATRR